MIFSYVLVPSVTNIKFLLTTSIHNQDRLVSSRHLFSSRKGIWEGNLTRAEALGKAEEFFFPSLDAPRTHLILPINHSAYREATGYESVIKRKGNDS